MKKRTQVILFILLSVSLLFPAKIVLSQDGELSDLLVSTIWQLHLREGLYSTRLQTFILIQLELSGAKAACSAHESPLDCVLAQQGFHELSREFDSDNERIYPFSV